MMLFLPDNNNDDEDKWEKGGSKILHTYGHKKIYRIEHEPSCSKKKDQEASCSGHFEKP